MLLGKRLLAVLPAKVLISKAKGRPFHDGKNGGDCGSFLAERVTHIGRGTVGTNCTKMAFFRGSLSGGLGRCDGGGEGDWSKE